MIVIWENFVKVWTNFGNLIENFQILKKIFKILKKTLIKISKNLTKIWNVSFKLFSFSQLTKLYYRVKTFHYKTRQNLWGRTLLKKFPPKSEGGAAAFPSPLAPDPMDCTLKRIACIGTRGRERGRAPNP